jgi:hypothetical protein
MIFSRHRFTRTFAEPFAAPTAREAAVIEEELQQAVRFFAQPACTN